MGEKPACNNNYLQQEGANLAGDMLELWKNNYNNYAPQARTSYYARRNDNDEGNTASLKRGDYGRPASALKYTILPYDFNGMTEQLVPLEEGLLGQTWINTLTDKRSELSNELSGRGLRAVRMHELMHQMKPYADEVTIRKETQKELLTQFGTTEGTYHEARYA